MKTDIEIEKLSEEIMKEFIKHANLCDMTIGDIFESAFIMAYNKAQSNDDIENIVKRTKCNSDYPSASKIYEEWEQSQKFNNDQISQKNITIECVQEGFKRMFYYLYEVSKSVPDMSLEDFFREFELSTSIF